MHVGYENEVHSAELATIISYPTSLSGILALSKMPTKYWEFFPTLFIKTTDFQLVFNFEQTPTVTIFGEHGVISNINEWGWVGYEELCRSRSMLSTEIEGWGG